MSLLSLCGRWDLFEEQFNDFTELHQNEIFNLKEELASMAEKIADQSHESGENIQLSHIDVSKWLLVFIMLYTLAHQAI